MKESKPTARYISKVLVNSLHGEELFETARADGALGVHNVIRRNIVHTSAMRMPPLGGTRHKATFVAEKAV